MVPNYEFFHRQLPICMSIDATPIARKRSVRKRHRAGKALSLASIHEPPDKPLAENGKASKKDSPKDCSNKRSAFPCGIHRKKPRDNRR